MPRLVFLLAVFGCKAPATDLITVSPVDPADLRAVSRFRSCCGHDYSHRSEDNRSMKHYLYGGDSYVGTDNQLPIYAPFDGKVSSIKEDSYYLDCYDDMLGEQVFLRSKAQPGIYIKLFHVNPQVSKGQVKAGDLVAYGDMRNCRADDSSVKAGVGETVFSFDISLQRGDRPYPMFESMTDEAFAPWLEAGVQSRSDTLVGEAERDANPCTDYWHECWDDVVPLWSLPVDTM